MPVKSCTVDGKPAIKWGDDGAAHVYDPADPVSKRNARKAVITEAVRKGDLLPVEKSDETDHGRSDRVSMIVPICKSDDEQRLVYGVVLEPNVVDAQNEWETPEVIQDTAHRFLSRYNSETELGLQHNTFGEIGVEVVESYVAPQDLDFDGELTGDNIIRKGSWVLVVHVSDDDTWQKVKDGDITGFSVGGTATVYA